MSYARRIAKDEVLEGWIVVVSLASHLKEGQTRELSGFYGFVAYMNKDTDEIVCSSSTYVDLALDSTIQGQRGV